MYTCKKLLKWLICGAAFIMPGAAFAGGIVDSINLAPFVPWVLDAMMMVATTVYEFFTGNGGGLVYVMIWIFLGGTIVITLVKMYFPKDWVAFIGFSGGGELFEGKITGTQIFEKIARPMLRAIIAVVLLLRITPQTITTYMVNPFLSVGSIYSEIIMKSINETGMQAPDVACPQQVIENGWISQESCEFLVQPVADISHANNKIVKRGFQYISNGLLGLMTLIPNGGEDFLNLVTGIILVFTFIASNLFMALLIIQGIFNFGMQLILYPVNVLTYVIKPNDKWVDLWPAFDGLVKALQQLIVTIIACMFILGINIAVVKALFQWNSSVFVAAAGGTSVSNMPAAGTNTGFGDHSIMWLSALLTFFLMFKIFEMTRKQLDLYVGKGMDKLYNQTVKDTKAAWNGAKQLKGKYQATKDNIGVLADATGVVGKKIGSSAKGAWNWGRRLFGGGRP